MSCTAPLKAESFVVSSEKFELVVDTAKMMQQLLPAAAAVASAVAVVAN